MALATPGKRDAHGTWFKDVTFDAASVAAGVSADQTVTVPDVLYGVDEVHNVIPPVAAAAGVLVQTAHVSADATVTLRLFNSTGGPVDLASGTWRFVFGRYGA